MIIKNKATKKEYEITQEQWANIVANVNLRYKYSVVSTKDISNRIIEDSEKIIINPQEIINFKKYKTTKKKKKRISPVLLDRAVQGLCLPQSNPG